MVDKYILKELQMSYPDLYPKIVDICESDDMEYVLTLADGRVVIYDNLNHTVRAFTDVGKNLRRELTEQEWRTEFSKRLCRKIQLKGISQERLSELSGISIVSLSKYLNGKSTPSFYNATKLSKVLGCYVSELVDFE